MQMQSAANDTEKPKKKSALAGRLTATQRAYLEHGLHQPGGKLPLFDKHGQQISPVTIRSCIEKGWAEPWFSNPIKPDWLICRLTELGRKALASSR